MGGRYLVGLCLVLLACQSTPKRELASKLDISSAPRGKTFTEWGDYIIDSNDVLNLHVQDKAGLDGIYRVSPSGYISVPFVGMIRARGLTEMQLRESLVLKLRPYAKMPRVSVSVNQMNSYIVYFEGRIAKPGTYKLDSRTTLQQGLALAGGIRGELDGRIILVRDTPEGVRKRFETTLQKLQEGQSFLDNLLLERGDLIIIE